MAKLYCEFIIINVRLPVAYFLLSCSFLFLSWRQLVLYSYHHRWCPLFLHEPPFLRLLLLRANLSPYSLSTVFTCPAAHRSSSLIRCLDITSCKQNSIMVISSFSSLLGRRKFFTYGNYDNLSFPCYLATTEGLRPESHGLYEPPEFKAHKPRTSAGHLFLLHVIAPRYRKSQSDCSIIRTQTIACLFLPIQLLSPLPHPPHTISCFAPNFGLDR